MTQRRLEISIAALYPGAVESVISKLSDLAVLVQSYLPAQVTFVNMYVNRNPDKIIIVLDDPAEVTAQFLPAIVLLIAEILLWLGLAFIAVKGIQWVVQEVGIIITRSQILNNSSLTSEEKAKLLEIYQPTDNISKYVGYAIILVGGLIAFQALQTFKR